MEKTSKKKSPWRVQLWRKAKKESPAWVVHLFFNSSTTGFVVSLIKELSKVSWSDIWPLAVWLFLAILSGYWMVRRTIHDFHVSSLRADPKSRLERSRQRGISEFFDSLIHRAEGGKDWGQEQTDDWILEVEYAINPLFPAQDVVDFTTLFSKRDLSPDRKRRLCITWLTSARYKLWVH